MKSKQFKVETIEEYLARGGTIKKMPTGASSFTKDSIKNSSNNSGITAIISLEDAELYYSEDKPKNKKTVKKSQPRVDLSALPEHIRKKYTAIAMQEMGQDVEIDLEDDDND